MNTNGIDDDLTADPPMPPLPSSNETLRLTYEFDGRTVHLIAQDRVDVSLPHSSPDSHHVGHVVDVLAADGTTLSRVPIHADLGDTREIFGLPGEPIVRVPDPHPSGAFSVLVPAPSGATRATLLHLDGHPLAPGTSQPHTVVLSDDAIEE